MGTLEDALKQFMAANPDIPEAVAEESPVAVEPRAAVKDKLQVVMERKGRGGKTATIIAGFTCSDAEVAEIARELKSRLGAGGSVRGGEILIQGDRRAEVVTLLRQKGFKC